MALLVDKAAYEKAIRGLAGTTDEQKEWIEASWLAYVVWWDQRARWAKKRFYICRTIVVVGGVLTPALVGSAMAGVNPIAAKIVPWLVLAVSLLVGIAAGIEELYRFGEIWRDKRDAAEVLKSEGRSYFQRIGKYRGKLDTDAYDEFATTVEDMIRSEIKTYLRATRTKQEATVFPDHSESGTNNVTARTVAPSEKGSTTGHP